MKFISNKLGNKLIYAEHVERKRQEFIESLKDGQLVEEEIKAKRPQKSYQQVKTVMGYMINETIAQANDLGIDIADFLDYLLDKHRPKNVGLTRNFLHAVMYDMDPIVDENGRRVTLSKMDSIQAAQLFERYRAIVSGLGIDIRDPDPRWRDRHIETG